jgi:hypothetical protein
MIITRVDIKTLSIDSILLILLLLSGLVVYHKTDYNKHDFKSTTTTTEISIINNNGTTSAGNQDYLFQKIWIPNSGNFKILSFNRSQFLESKEVDQKILRSEKIQEKYIRVPISFNIHPIFPHESNEIPILS